jgi:hypothetical protein
VAFRNATVYNGEAILIEGEGTTYADTLKTLREKMVDKETLKEIKGVRKTLKGGALLTLKEGGTRKLKSTLEEILQNNNEGREGCHNTPKRPG